MSLRDEERQQQREIEELLEESEELEAGQQILLKVVLSQGKVLAALVDAVTAMGPILKQILAELKPSPAVLNQIKIVFGGNMAVGPVTLSQQTPNTVARILGFDQFGSAFSIDFTATPVTYTLDDPTQDTLAANADGSANISWITPGGKTVNLTATCAGFTDTEQINNIAVVVPPPVLSSIKIDFSAPTA